MDQQELRTVYEEIDKRSDELMKAAEAFGDRHIVLSSSQVSGLLNTANCADSLTTLLTVHIQKQAAKRTINDQERVFWQGLRQEIEGLRKPAEEIGKVLASVPATDKARRERLSQIQLLLVRDYVQHLAAHEIYRKASQEGHHDNLA